MYYFAWIRILLAKYLGNPLGLLSIPLPNAKPIGEFANNGPPAAIANAIADAVGIRLFELPLTAERIYYLLKDQTTNTLVGSDNPGA